MGLKYVWDQIIGEESVFTQVVVKIDPLKYDKLKLYKLLEKDELALAC